MTPHVSYTPPEAPPKDVPDPISATLLICEKVLKEQPVLEILRLDPYEAVLSVIRMVEVFHVTLSSDVPIEKQTVQMQLLILMRFDREDEAERTFELHLVRPNGESTHMGNPRKIRPPLGKYPELGRGINIIATANVAPLQFGAHHFRFTMNGKEIASAPFMLAREEPN